MGRGGGGRGDYQIKFLNSKCYVTFTLSEFGEPEALVQVLEKIVMHITSTHVLFYPSEHTT